MKKVILSAVCFMCAIVSAGAQERIQMGNRYIDPQNNETLEVGEYSTGNKYIVKKGKTAIVAPGSEIEEISFEHMGNETLRMGVAGQQADIRPDTSNANKIMFTNPNGNEQASMEFKKFDEQTGEIDFVARDEKTGEELARVSGKKGEYVDMKQKFKTGEEMELYLRKTGPGENDMSGTVKMKSDDMQMDISMNNGIKIGTIARVQNGYRHEITMYADGTASNKISDTKTKKHLYTVKGRMEGDEYSYIYDANGKLIAEGKDPDEIKTIKVYDKQSFARFMEIMDSVEDDD